MSERRGPAAELDRSNLDAHVETPGVAVIVWRQTRKAGSHALDDVVAQVRHRYPEVRFGVVDVARDERLAEEWGVDQVPALMIHRDGTLLYAGSGEISAEGLETLLSSALAMDLSAARRSVNGHHGRFTLGFQVSGRPASGLRNDNGEGGASSSDGDRVK